MRTTVDLPPGLHYRVRLLADQEHQTFSSMVADLVAQSLESRDEPSHVRIDPVTGLAKIDLGRDITQAEIDAFLDEDE
ncbi:MAG: hypothetical protein LBK95_01210 [Bifidobacteriaceae bacterium]|nr:hypothetical protein [Bifidobacteriaceae bacterium]